MTTKPKTPAKPAGARKPAMTSTEKAAGRYAAEVAAAKRDGWKGRSAALTAWQKGQAVMVRVDRLDRTLDELNNALEAALLRVDGTPETASGAGQKEDNHTEKEDK